MLRPHYPQRHPLRHGPLGGESDWSRNKLSRGLTEWSKKLISSPPPPHDEQRDDQQGNREEREWNKIDQ
jgi:hypothetical protein